jgi:hypothetical protein
MPDWSTYGKTASRQTNFRGGTDSNHLRACSSHCPVAGTVSIAESVLIASDRMCIQQGAPSAGCRSTLDAS